MEFSRTNINNNNNFNFRMRRIKMKTYRVMFTYEEEVKATDPWEAIIQVGSDSRILEHLGSDAIVEEIDNESVKFI